MARITSTLVQKGSGSVGNMTLKSWKGILVLSQKAEVVSNPRSEGQTNQRTQFKSANDFMKKCLNLVRIGFKSLAIGKSEANICVSKNIKNFSETIPDSVIDPTALVISQGNNGILKNAAYTEDTDVVVTWDYDPTQANTNAKDTVNVLIYNYITGVSREFVNVATRDAERAVVGIGMTPTSDFKAIVFTQGFVTKEASNSQVLNFV